MAGYGNRNAPDLAPESLAHEHSNTRFDRADGHAYSGGHDTYGSGATGGAGFGNKSAVDPSSSASDDSLRFDSHGETGAYKGHGTNGRHPSGFVGGVGYGNKTGSFSEKHDSTLGKLMEKAGHVMHNENLAAKGAAKREAQGYEGQK